MTTTLKALQNWVDEVASQTLPDNIQWCDGSEVEYNFLIKQMNKSGDLEALNQSNYPNCYLHRSDPTDVARVEHLTFICTKEKEDAGPNNNWMAPMEAHNKIDQLFKRCHERKNYVCYSLLHGSGGLTIRQMWRRNN